MVADRARESDTPEIGRSDRDRGAPEGHKDSRGETRSTGTFRTEQSADLRGAPTIEDLHADPGEGRVGHAHGSAAASALAAVGLFRSQAQAERAVRSLRAAGLGEEDISIIAHDKRGGHAGRGAEIGEGRDDSLALIFDAPSITAGSGLEHENYGAGFWTPAAVGGFAGMLTSSGLLNVAGIGQIFAAGPLAGAVAGAVSGSIANGLLELGIPDERSRYIESKVREGHVLAVVHTDDPAEAERAAAVMRESGAEDVEVHGPDAPRSSH